MSISPLVRVRVEDRVPELASSLPYSLGLDDGVGSGGATLAQLYALRDGAEPVAAVEEPVPVGLYL